MKWALITIIILFFTTACSPQQRLAKLLKNHPQLFADSVKTDTIHIHHNQFDTIVHFNLHDSIHSDTFIIEKPGFITRIIRTGGNLDVTTKLKDTTIVTHSHIRYITLPAPKQSFYNRYLKQPTITFLILASLLFIIHLFRQK